MTVQRAALLQSKEGAVLHWKRYTFNEVFRPNRDRDIFNELFGWIAGGLAVLSLVCAAVFQLRNIQDHWFGKLVVGVWVLLPPIFFWCDWVFFCTFTGDDATAKLDRAKHTHDLSRNIWLGFVIVLGVLFGIKLPG
jgi:hypothetical protein